MTTNKMHGAKPGQVTPKKIATKVKTKATKSICTFDSNGDDLALTTSTFEARASSQVIAKHLHAKHENLFALIKKHRGDFEQLGLIRFQTGLIDGRGRPEKFVMLNEDQSLLALTYSRNTDRVRQLKVKLVKAFGQARRAADMHRTEYLPSYHQLQDAIHAKSATASNEGLVHMNIAKLMNKSMGIEAGQRGSLTIPKQAMMIVAQTVASRAMQAALDHRDGYQRVKQSMLALNSLALDVTGQGAR